jgi:glutathione synthase
MAEEAQIRGFEIFVYQVETLSWQEGKVSARAKPAKVQRVKGDHVSLGEEVVLDSVEDVDVVLMRQDPPFDMSYITAAHMLEFLKGKTLVVNDPFWVRSSPEKIVPLLFPDLMPPTLVSRDVTTIKAFQAEHQDIVVKPLFGNSDLGPVLHHQQRPNHGASLCARRF